MKIQRHDPNSRMIWPSAGASTGAMMNTAITSEKTRAISRPPYRSRIKANDRIRGPAAPKPSRNRPASSMSNRLAVKARNVPARNSARPTMIAGLRPVLSEIGP